MTTEIAEQRYAAFRHGAFLRYLTARFLATFAAQIVSVAVGWQIYDLTRDPFDLGLVGIIQFLPALLLVLVTGAVADRFGRRLIMALSSFLEALCALAILLLTVRGLNGAGPVFAVLAMFGIVVLADRRHRRPRCRRPALRARRRSGVRSRRTAHGDRRAAGAVDPQTGKAPAERETDA